MGIAVGGGAVADGRGGGAARVDEGVAGVVDAEQPARRTRTSAESRLMARKTRRPGPRGGQSGGGACCEECTSAFALGSRSRHARLSSGRPPQDSCASGPRLCPIGNPPPFRPETSIFSMTHTRTEPAASWEEAKVKASGRRPRRSPRAAARREAARSGRIDGGEPPGISGALVSIVASQRESPSCRYGYNVVSHLASLRGRVRAQAQFPIGGTARERFGAGSGATPGPTVKSG